MTQRFNRGWDRMGTDEFPSWEFGELRGGDAGWEKEDKLGTVAEGRFPISVLTM